MAFAILNTSPVLVVHLAEAVVLTFPFERSNFCFVRLHPRMLVFVLETQFLLSGNTRAKFLAKVSSSFFFSGRIERSKRLVAGFQELVLDCWKNGLWTWML